MLAELIIKDSAWESIKVDNAEIILKPKHFHSNYDWLNEETRIRHKLPYIHIKYNDDKISYIKASCGIVREIPIFYSTINDFVVIADDPKYISTKHENENKFNQECVHEFKKFGYILGNRTLFEDVYSLRAGEAIEVNNGEVKIKREYLYNDKDFIHSDNDELKKELGRVSEEIFNDLIESLNGKTAIVPLSGGYDSRFIVSMLKKGGYNNVHCYAWGAEKETQEKVISKEIADKFGYKWESINYSEEKWKETCKSEWFDDCLSYACKHTSISGGASLPFLNTLRKNHSPEDSVLIPGHTGDFIGGGHIPSYINQNSNIEDIITGVLNKHLFSLYKKEDKALWNKINLQLEELKNSAEPFQIYERWEWQERQAKFIVNSIRYYEYWDFNWNLPFWDYKFLDFWSGISLQNKYGLNLYHSFLEDVIFNQLDVNYIKSSRTTIKSRVTDKSKLIFQSIGMLEVVKKIKNKLVDSNSQQFNFDYIFSHLIKEEINEGVDNEILVNPYAKLAYYTLSLMK